MVCYRCGAEVGKEEYCPSCGENMEIFHKVNRISNSYYNDGLQKAGVRDLSGAIVSLKRCLKFNKYHIDARNLLGLIYFEMGEVVAALSEWVISKNYRDTDNRANGYLENVQHNANRLDSTNQTIKKYNQALLYCKNGNRDLAEIQLKKVLSLNPKLIKGHQLLALLYIQDEKYELAKKTLRLAGKIDTDNTTTLRYLKEVNARLREKKPNKKNENDDLISYQSGNETIIMPKRFRESSIGASLLYIILGLVVGIAATYFLIVPGVRSTAQSQARSDLNEANATILSDSQTISDLEAQIADLQVQLTSAQDASNIVQGQITSYEQLLSAYVAFTGGDVAGAGNALATVDTAQLSEGATAIYTALNDQVTLQYQELLYSDGYSAYSRGDYATAIDNLKRVCDMDQAYGDGNAAYYLAQSYRRSGDLDSARPYYQFVIDNYPNTERATTAQNYVNQEN